MSEQATWGLMGYGTIGREVARQIAQPEVSERMGLQPEAEFIIRSSGVMKADGETPTGKDSLADIHDLPDVTFVALPSTDDGLRGYQALHRILKGDGIAVTAEKGALANFYPELRAESGGFANLGINATVGGGTRMLQVAREYCRDMSNVTQLHMAVNGTLAAIMSSVGPRGQSEGMSLGQAVNQAVALGFAEPGAESAYDVIAGEAQGDIPKKTAIMLHSLGIAPADFHWSDLEFTLGKKDIANVIEEASVRRFIVSIYSSKYLNGHVKCPEDGMIGGFVKNYGDWRVVGGFRDVGRNPLFSALGNLTGPGNGIVIGLGPDETDGVYTVTGPGAGPRPTANTMLDDYIARSVGQIV